MPLRTYTYDVRMRKLFYILFYCTEINDLLAIILVSEMMLYFLMSTT